MQEKHDSLITPDCERLADRPHALSAADRLFTRDRAFYRRYFAGLKVLDP